MSNPAINWMKEHPGMTAGLAAGIGLLVYIMTRSGSGGTSSTVSAIAQSQAQQAAINAQNAGVMAQLQAQTNTAAYAAQVQNNQNAAALAATIAQYNAQTETAKLAADVQKQQTGVVRDVTLAQINAQTEAYNTQVNAESKLLQSQLDYQTQIANQIIPGAVQNLNNASNISANATNILDTILGSPYSAQAASQTEAIKQQAGAYQTVGVTNAIVGGATSVIKSLFG